MGGPRNYHAKWNQSDNETPTSNAITYMLNLKKGHNELLCKQIVTHRLWKTYGFQRRQVWGWGDALRVWDGNAIKFGCDDCCTTRSVIKFIE